MCLLALEQGNMVGKSVFSCFRFEASLYCTVHDAFYMMHIIGMGGSMFRVFTCCYAAQHGVPSAWSCHGDAVSKRFVLGSFLSS